MEINLNSNGFANVGMGRETFGTLGVAAGRETIEASRDASLRVTSSSSRVQSADLASAEPIVDVPETALSRDDQLGKLVNAAFNLPPPAMPVLE